MKSYPGAKQSLLSGGFWEQYTFDCGSARRLPSMRVSWQVLELGSLPVGRATGCDVSLHSGNSQSMFLAVGAAKQLLKLLSQQGNIDSQ